MAELDPGVLESVLNSNFKSLAEMGAVNATTASQRLQILAEKSLATSLENMDTTSIVEGLGLAEAQRGDLSKNLADLGSAVSAIEGYLKAAGNIPPVTP
jgi:hypothetical protein